MQFVMMLCSDPSTWDMTPEQDAAAMKEVYAWFEHWQTAGKISSGGAELDAPDKAKTIRRGPDGKPVVTDGPYLELKEVVGGFIILETDGIDEAVEIASGWPWPGSSIEVRPVIVR